VAFKLKDYRKIIMKYTQTILVIFILSFLMISGCVSMPKGSRAAEPFSQEKYLGRWYEIARMDFTQERNLDSVTAEYSLREDGKIKVVNQGYNYKTGEWKRAEGKAAPVGNGNDGRLKVSFFGPFYSGYNVIAIDPDYKYALVYGDNTKYMWLLSREKTMPEEVVNKYLQMARGSGYKVEELVWPKQ